VNTARLFLIAVGLILGGRLAFAQDVSRYRAYVLESSLESVIATSDAHAADAKTLHERPAAIQRLEWRAPHADSRNTLADRCGPSPSRSTTVIRRCHGSSVLRCDQLQ